MPANKFFASTRSLFHLFALLVPGHTDNFSRVKQPPFNLGKVARPKARDVTFVPQSYYGYYGESSNFFKKPNVLGKNRPRSLIGVSPKIEVGEL